jgi:alpha-tubulin suppressor-like RCC1 family protein
VYKIAVVASAHGCVATSAASICTGDNSHGEVGPLTLSSQPTPNGLDRMLSVGLGHSCGTTDTRSVDCWGDRTLGQVDGVRAPASPVVAVNLPFPASSVAAIAAGDTFTCAASGAGDVACWGGHDNWTTDTFNGTPGALPGIVQKLPAGLVLSLDSGARHACAVKQGNVYCWGVNADGQATGSPSALPVAPTLVALPEAAVAVATGAFHTCAITGSGAIYCWGSNALGQLGPSVNGNQTGPVRVFRGIRAVGPISAGDDFTCALLEDSLVHCWGAPEFVQPGGVARDRLLPCM